MAGEAGVTQGKLPPHRMLSIHEAKYCLCGAASNLLEDKTAEREVKKAEADIIICILLSDIFKINSQLAWWFTEKDTGRGVPQPKVCPLSPPTNSVALSGLSWEMRCLHYLMIFRSLLPPEFPSGKLRSGRSNDRKPHGARLHIETVLLPLPSHTI